MDYGLIGKIEKARRYAQERDRFRFHQFEVAVRGDNNAHTVRYQDGEWFCDCNYFRSHGRCSHTMALERLLEGMLGEEE